MCTGYLHSYPFLRSESFCFGYINFFLGVFIIMFMFPTAREKLRMKCKNLFYPPGLYKVLKLAHVGDEYGDVLPTRPLQGGKTYFSVGKPTVMTNHELFFHFIGGFLGDGMDRWRE